MGFFKGEGSIMRMYPQDSFATALRYKEQLVSIYTGQGYTTRETSRDNQDEIWTGESVSSHTLLIIRASKTSVIDAPMTIEAETRVF